MDKSHVDLTRGPRNTYKTRMFAARNDILNTFLHYQLMLTISPGRRRFMFLSGWWAVLSSPTVALPFDPSKPVELLHRKAQKGKRTRHYYPKTIIENSPHEKTELHSPRYSSASRNLIFEGGGCDVIERKENKRNISSVRENQNSRI